MKVCEYCKKEAMYPCSTSTEVGDCLNLTQKTRSAKATLLRPPSKNEVTPKSEVQALEK